MAAESTTTVRMASWQVHVITWKRPIRHSKLPATIPPAEPEDRGVTGKYHLARFPPISGFIQYMPTDEQIHRAYKLAEAQHPGNIAMLIMIAHYGETRVARVVWKQSYLRSHPEAEDPYRQILRDAFAQ